MLVKELAFGIPVDANVGIKAHHMAAPQLLLLFVAEAQRAFLRSARDQTLERSLAPQPLCKCSVIDLEAVVHSHRLALLRLARRRSQGKRREK